MKVILDHVSVRIDGLPVATIAYIRQDKTDKQNVEFLTKYKRFRNTVFTSSLTYN